MSLQSVLSIPGKRSTGSSVRTENVIAANSVANIVKSSLGPVGLDKMIVDDVGDVTVTNDGATILKLLEVEHPAARVLVELAQLQDEEVGDGTTSVVIIAAELLKAADELVKQKIHPTSIIAGYKLACKEACRYIQNNLTISTEELGKECVVAAARTTMSSKVVSVDSEYFGQMVVDAAMAVRVSDGKGGYKYPIKAVNILKAHGRSARESVLVDGYALNCTIASHGEWCSLNCTIASHGEWCSLNCIIASHGEWCSLNCTIASHAMTKKIVGAKIACLDFSLQKEKMKLGVHVLLSDPSKLQAIREREADITKERIDKILKSGANVVLTTQGIDDLCLKYFVEAGAMAVRRVKKVDMKRIAKATGASLLTTLCNLEGEETFEASYLGEAAEVSQERICDDELIIIKSPTARSASSIILRGPNDFYCDEMERSLHDALCVVRRVLESSSVVCGGGSVEAALSVYLENFATTLSSREQLAIAAFAQSLLVIPNTLTVNAARDATELVPKLRAFHHSSQVKADHKKLKYFGLDLMEGNVRDNREAGVFEPGMSKIKQLKFATEAAITILRIDDMIRLEPEQKEESHYQNARRQGML
ncbi:Chaperonin Cpn60/TCP-1 family [Trinorchestia longiramus]|nr:Chaperonin Cpn60/TCP-1 family [Trinorchestia longiramus]